MPGLTKELNDPKVHTHCVYKGSSMSSAISRVFMNGNSQAVRIPQEFRLDSSRVEISRTAEGDLVLHPVQNDRGAALLDALDAFSDEFVQVLEAQRSEQQSAQDREAL